MNAIRLLQTPPLTPLQKWLLDTFQHGFPLSPTPYADIAKLFGVTEAEVLNALTELSRKNLLSRIGAVFKPHRIGVSTLAAMTVPLQDLLNVATFLNRLPEVNHNYEREHALNLWFVLTATDAAHLLEVIDEIEAKTGYPVISLPMLEAFHIDLGFKLSYSH